MGRTDTEKVRVALHMPALPEEAGRRPTGHASARQ